MSTTPVATPHTDGRIFGTDWSIANVATLLRSNAARGAWRSTGKPGGYTTSINQKYLRSVSAQHLPTDASLIFMQLEERNCWYASLGFARAGAYLPWNGDTAEQWLWALFGEDRPRVVGEESGNGSVRQYTLAQMGA